MTFITGSLSVAGVAGSSLFTNAKVPSKGRSTS
jgi:hypothetical protein